VRDVAVGPLERLRGVVGGHDDYGPSARGLSRGRFGRGERHSLIYGRQGSGLLHSQRLSSDEHRRADSTVLTPLATAPSRLRRVDWIFVEIWRVTGAGIVPETWALNGIARCQQLDMDSNRNIARPGVSGPAILWADFTQGDSDK
jgi:hypothetical protein